MQESRSSNRNRSGHQAVFATSALIMAATLYAGVSWLRAKSELTVPTPEPAVMTQPLALPQPFTEDNAIEEAVFVQPATAEEIDQKETSPAPEVRSVAEIYTSGLTHLRSGNSTDAVEEFEEILDRKPGHVRTLVNLGRAQIALREFEDALNSVDRAIQIDSTDSQAWRVRGRALHSWNEIDGAVSAYEKSIALNPENPYAYNNLGLIYIERSRFGDAVPVLEKAIAQLDNVAFFYNNLGIAYETTGRLAEAAEAFQTAVELDPESEKASTSLARVQQLVDSKPVEDIAEKASDEDPGPDAVTGDSTAISTNSSSPLQEDTETVELRK